MAELTLRREMDEWLNAIEPYRQERINSAIEAKGKALEAAELSLRALGYLNPETDGYNKRPGWLQGFNGAVNAAPAVMVARSALEQLRSMASAIEAWRKANREGYNETNRQLQAAKQAVLAGL